MPGLYVQVHVPVQKKTALLVPEVAVANDQEGSYVLIVSEKNVVWNVVASEPALRSIICASSKKALRERNGSFPRVCCALLPDDRSPLSGKESKRLA